MDRADPALLARIVGALQDGRVDGWADVHQLRAWQAGDRTFVDFHMVVPETWTVLQLHEATERCRALLRASLGDATEVTIHFDPDTRGDDPSPWDVAGATRIRTAPASGRS